MARSRSARRRARERKRTAKREAKQPQEATVAKPQRRVGPTPETVRHLQRDALQDLLALGPEHGGISLYDHEALLEIEAAFHVIERAIGGGGPTWIGDRVGSPGEPELSDGAARQWAIWNLWATAFWERTKCVGIEIAAIIEARRPVDAETVQLLRRAAVLWDETRRKYDEARRAERKVRHTIAGQCIPST